jgi:hypothetical protein
MEGYILFEPIWQLQDTETTQLPSYLSKRKKQANTLGTKRNTNCIKFKNNREINQGTEVCKRSKESSQVILARST